MIFGGLYQGKLAYALERFSLAETDIYFCNDGNIAMPKGKKAVYEIDRWILALVRADADVTINIAQFADINQNAVVICNDVSCGVVPVDGVLRKWREETGRAMGTLAQRSDEVIRLFCGIPSRVK